MQDPCLIHHKLKNDWKFMKFYMQEPWLLLDFRKILWDLIDVWINWYGVITIYAYKIHNNYMLNQNNLKFYMMLDGDDSDS